MRSSVKDINHHHSFEQGFGDEAVDEFDRYLFLKGLVIARGEVDGPHASVSQNSEDAIRTQAFSGIIHFG